MKKTLGFFFCLWMTLPALAQPQDSLFVRAHANGQQAREGFRRCIRFVNGWLAEADPASSLIPRNLKEGRDIWNPQDAAADNYPFMVLTAAVLRPDLFRGRMLEMLRTEQKLTSRVGRVPDIYSFSRKTFSQPLDTSQLIFGAAEYMKDGLVPLTEWLGKSPWSDRMLGILDDLSRLVDVPTRIEGDFYGNSPVVEVNGDLLQVLSRMYWMTGDKKYLAWATRIGDYFFSDAQLPTRSLSRLRLRDHGCEIVAGLTELYLMAHFASPAKKKQWQPYLYEMLDCILEKGRNEHGLFYDEINPVTGEVVVAHLADTWGYTLNTYYTVFLLDGVTRYREAVLKSLASLDTHYHNHDWEGNSDGYADAIESALNLYFREPLPSVKSWLDSQIQVMWSFQQPSGVIEGWHGDGNFARTTLMYCLWKTAGLTTSDWNDRLVYGTVVDGQKLYLSLTDEKADWRGNLKFGYQKHRETLHLPIDYPRINQFQEWYPVQTERTYTLTNAATGRTETIKGKKLIEGYPVAVRKGETLRLVLTPKQ